MKKTTILLFSLFFAVQSFGQLNMSLVGQLSYNSEANDIWGWTAPDGTEYAIVGLVDGTSIVSLADPASPEEVAFIPGENSTWRDIKTWENFAYVTTDQPGTNEGLLVIDLSGLPEDIDWYNWRPDLPGLGQLSTCHNLYIDEFGYCYLAGCNVNAGGVLFIDVFSEPGVPQFVGPAPSIYAHDVYVRNNLMYSSQINAGTLGIYDVSDKQDPLSLASQPTPFDFTHNAWLSDDGNVVFTTDERANAPVAAYDISNLNDIRELDEFRPVNSLGSGVIPHNVHVWNDYLIISYYTDGGIIVDASRPENLIEVGNFDTFFGPDGGFFGAWGAYPFLPSGLVLVSDINSGLYVLEPDYVRAAWLEGKVTNANSGAPINNVEVTILSEQPNLANSDALGEYATGQALPGTFSVTFGRSGYATKTVDATLVNGEVTVLDVELEPLVPFNLMGATVTDTDGDPVPFAEVLLIGEQSEYETGANADGNFFLINVFEGLYDLYAASWGYFAEIENFAINQGTPVTVPMQRGYRDAFVFDLGWTTETIGATSGGWERGAPVGTNFEGAIANPGQDAPQDFGNQCYVTGNGGGSGGTDDVDDGVVRLISPVMDLTDYQDARLSYRTWFYNDGGTGDPPNDALVVSVTNGQTTVVLEEITESTSAWRPLSEFHLGEFIQLNAQVQIIFETSDLANSGHIVEAAVDDFLVIDDAATSTGEIALPAELQAFPNPFSDQVTIRLPADYPNTYLDVIDATGRQVDRIRLANGQQTVVLGADLPNGFYFARLESGATVQLVKGR